MLRIKTPTYAKEKRAIQKKMPGREHPDTAVALSKIAAVLQDQGDFAGARPLIERALAILVSSRARKSRHAHARARLRSPPERGRTDGGRRQGGQPKGEALPQVTWSLADPRCSTPRRRRRRTGL
jgi:hypothetical protein